MPNMSRRFLLWSRFVEPTTLGALAQNLGRPCPPPPSISLQSLALALTGTALSVVSIVPPDEPAVPGVPRTAVDPEYQEALRPRIHVLFDTLDCSELGLKGSGIACLWDGGLFRGKFSGVIPYVKKAESWRGRNRVVGNN
jgi:hypothetical protein